VNNVECHLPAKVTQRIIECMPHFCIKHHELLVLAAAWRTSSNSQPILYSTSGINQLPDYALDNQSDGREARHSGHVDGDLYRRVARPHQVNVPRLHICVPAPGTKRLINTTNTNRAKLALAFVG
jgi:hypothetical protein